LISGAVITYGLRRTLHLSQQSVESIGVMK
jgi:hypothetical protein